ncbi:Gmad2 immunoglobulin-like domain-containing protein [Kribbella catacumbae]|uniref:Gmad2 immunoglobulin-like domain-containing protein n=1 Tax=Kribbella catacumbae TaxID=460086 RepID=UPI00036AF224|nr:Gmad2 immunoglobulin-like domain-containing protein [Kribbella catacumbae]
MNDHRDDRRDDSFDELMRRAMSEEAGRIEPADGLHEIQARVRSQRKPVNRRPWVITAGAAMVGTAAAIGAFAVLNDNTKTAEQPSIAGGPDTTSSASAEPTNPPTAPPASPKPTPSDPAASKPPSTLPTSKVRAIEETDLKTPKAVSVYWLGQVVGVKKGPEFRLYRTFNQVTGKPALEALRTMTAPKAANDPDYDSPWSGASVSSVRYTDDLIMVDFERLPNTKLEPEVADMAAQQLVYTVQGALQRTTPVQITQQGRISPDLFGVIDTNSPLSRAQATDVQAMVWITSPENNQTVKQPVTVAGIAAAFEAQVDWRATNVKTKQTVTNYTMTKEGQKFSPFAFTPKLAPGEWLLEVYLTSPEDGRITDTDSKTISVR